MAVNLDPIMLQNVLKIAPMLGISLPTIGLIVQAFNDPEIFQSNGLINEEALASYQNQLTKPVAKKTFSAGCPCCGYLLEIDLN